MSLLKKIAIEKVGFGSVSIDGLNKQTTRSFSKNNKLTGKNTYRRLSNEEIEVLKSNNNHCTNWEQVLVSENFYPDQILNTKFYGYIRIGEMSKSALSYRDLELPTGIYNSCVINCDIGSHVALHNVRYIAHFIIHDHVMLSSIDEMVTSDTAKFGNGIIKEGESESIRIELELCNENGGRAVIPFEGMRVGDAFLWSRHRDDKQLQDRFKGMTENRFSRERGEYSEIGAYTVIKNSRTIKDVKIGSYAYIKGVNKLKNVTVSSCREAYSQIGEGCEIVNGIIGYGCRIFYGVKAVRFILSSFSQLKYGARLINSFLGENSTISCCEVLNSLLYAGHEQHHNNSFLCASLFMGQTNMAAGATVGSNHNSRAGDGELIAGRGFWPGLSVNLKHNSCFASFTLIVKGDFLYEINLKIPFCLVSNKMPENEIHIIPGYWFLYNMYALFRNKSKYKKRDKRLEKKPRYEYGILAPDTVNEIFEALQNIEYAVGKSSGLQGEKKQLSVRGRAILNSDKEKIDFPVLLDNVEYSKRKVKLLKAKEGYTVFKRMLTYYIATVILNFLDTHSYHELQKKIHLTKGEKRDTFMNIGGQLIPKTEYGKLLTDIRTAQLSSWEAVHKRYEFLDENYEEYKVIHAISCLFGADSFLEAEDSPYYFTQLIEEGLSTEEWIVEQVSKTRYKDYHNVFRQAVYASEKEMEAVLGNFGDNPLIKERKGLLAKYRKKVQRVKQALKVEMEKSLGSIG